MMTNEPADRASITGWAQAIANDHAHGLHDDLDTDDGCAHPGCEDAYWLLAQREERGTP